MSTEQCPQKCYAAYARISNVALDGTVVIFTQKAYARPKERWIQVQF